MAQMAGLRWRNWLVRDGQNGCFYSSANTAEYAERARARGKSDREVMRCLKRYVAREAYRALMRPHEIRRPEDASELVSILCVSI